jgi:hypothetical protein
MGDIRNASQILAGKSEVRDHLGNLIVDGRIILNTILK